MGKGAMNWESVETWERLVASVIASGVKLDLNLVAAFYGTTYHTLENRLRKTKKLAEELKAGTINGDDGSEGATPKAKSSTPRNAKTPKTPKSTHKNSPLDKVTNGRITKDTPTEKKIKQTMVKKERSDDDGSEKEGHEFGGFAFDIPTPEEDGMFSGGGVDGEIETGYGFDFSS